jgi:hypothetical protein
VLDHLCEEQKRAYIIADNKLAELAGWNEELLAKELADLRDADYDIDVIGFNDQELEELFTSLYDDSGDEKQDNIVPDVEDDPVSKVGDVWLLGEHKLLCGDSCKQESYQSLLGDELADMTFTDPPYNVNYGESAKDKLRSKGGIKAGRKIINDNLGDAFANFLLTCHQNIIRVTKGACYICMSSSELHTLQKAFVDAGGLACPQNNRSNGCFTLGLCGQPLSFGQKISLH